MFREEKVATCFVRQTVSWGSTNREESMKTWRWKVPWLNNSLLPQWNYFHFTCELVCISHLRSVVPKSYKLEVRPKSTSDEFLSRVIGRSEIVVYLTNRFQVAVRLFSNRSQMTSKCGKNISDLMGHRKIPPARGTAGIFSPLCPIFTTGCFTFHLFCTPN